MNDLSEVLARLQINITELERHQPDAKERLIEWSKKALSQQGKSSASILRAKNQTLNSRWWLLRQCLPDEALHSLNRHVLKELEQWERD